VKIFVVRKIASAAIVIMLAAACPGCLAGGAVGIVSSVAPMVAAGSAQLIGSQVAMKEASGTGASKEENSDECDQLLRVPPGVEEVRKTSEGVIESRQWKIGGDAGAPAWVLVNTGGSDNSWQPKPGITKLFFNPPLYEMLKPDKPQYLAYAPSQTASVSDSEEFDSMTGAFGAGVGTFTWRDRSYSYVLVKELPCFKPAKEK